MHEDRNRRMERWLAVAQTKDSVRGGEQGLQRIAVQQAPLVTPFSGTRAPDGSRILAEGSLFGDVSLWAKRQEERQRARRAAADRITIGGEHNYDDDGEDSDQDIDNEESDQETDCEDSDQETETAGASS